MSWYNNLNPSGAKDRFMVFGTDSQLKSLRRLSKRASKALEPHHFLLKDSKTTMETVLSLLKGVKCPPGVEETVWPKLRTFLANVSRPGELRSHCVTLTDEPINLGNGHYEFYPDVAGPKEISYTALLNLAADDSGYHDLLNPAEYTFPDNPTYHTSNESVDSNSGPAEGTLPGGITWVIAPDSCLRQISDTHEYTVKGYEDQSLTKVGSDPLCRPPDRLVGEMAARRGVTQSLMSELIVVGTRKQRNELQESVREDVKQYRTLKQSKSGTNESLDDQALAIECWSEIETQRPSPAYMPKLRALLQFCGISAQDKLALYESIAYCGDFDWNLNSYDVTLTDNENLRSLIFDCRSPSDTYGFGNGTREDGSDFVTAHHSVVIDVKTLSDLRHSPGVMKYNSPVPKPRGAAGTLGMRVKVEE